MSIALLQLILIPADGRSVDSLDILPPRWTIDALTVCRELEQHQAKAAIAGNRAALERIFAPDFRIINPAGAVASKEELLQLLTGGASPYASAVYERQQVDVYRDVVVSTGIETVVPNQGTQAGQSVRRRITQVWKREGGGWLLALRHATLVTVPP